MTADLEARLAAVEARQRAYAMHDPGCPAFAPYETAGVMSGLFAGMTKDQCVCWLADPATICQACGHVWKGHADGHCFHDAKPIGPPGDGRFELACRCAEAPAATP